MQRTSSRFRRRVATLSTSAVLATATFAVVAPTPALAATTLTAPERIYTFVDQVAAFAGTDPITGQNRMIAMDAVISPQCDTSQGNDYSITLCGRVQLTLNDSFGGKLVLEGTTQQQRQNMTPVLIAASGAVAETQTDTNIYLNGTLDQLNQSLANLKYQPGPGFEDGGTAPNLHVLVNDGSLASTNVSTTIKLRVEGDNGAPTVSGPVAPVEVPAGQETSLPASTSDPAVYTVVDPELCLGGANNLCDGTYDDGPLTPESDDRMLLVAWAECGAIALRSQVGWTTLGTTVANPGENDPAPVSLDSLLQLPVAGYEEEQSLAILASVPSAAMLALRPQMGSPDNFNTAFAGLASLADVRYALSQLTFRAPNQDATCNVHVAVSDLGNNGMPLPYPNPSPLPEYEIPNAKGSTITTTFQVRDSHPDVTVSSALPGPLAVAGPNKPALFTVVFSEAVTGFDNASTDLDFSDSDATGVSGSIIPTPDSSIYTVQASANGDGDIVLTIPAGAANAAAAPNATSDASTASATIEWDQTRPTVTIEQAATQADPTNGAPVVFTVEVSETLGTAPVQLDGDDIVLSGTAGATTAAVSQPDPLALGTFRVEVTGMQQSGTVIATVKEGAFVDLALNPSEASTSTDNQVTYDVTAPTVTVSKGAAQADPTSASAVLFEVTFSEPVFGFGTGSVTAGGAGATSAAVSGGPTSYLVTVTGMTTTGAISVSVGAGLASDAAGNLNLASPGAATVQWVEPAAPDTESPTVMVAKAAAQADPTSVSPIVFEVAFSEPVLGFAAGDVSVTGPAGTAVSKIVAALDGMTFTVEVAGMTESGTVTVDIPAGVVTDGAGNPNLAAPAAASVEYELPPVDTTAPTVTVAKAAGQPDPTSATPILFQVTFSEPVVGFTTGDVTLGGTAGASSAVVSGGPTVYTVTVTGMSATGTVTVAVAAGVAEDEAGNTNEASPMAASVQWTQPAGPDPDPTPNPTPDPDPTPNPNPTPDPDPTPDPTGSLTVDTPAGPVHVAVSSGSALTAFTSSAPSVPAPAGVTFPYGQLSFTATTTPGALVTFTLTLPAAVTDFFKLTDGTWSSFAWDGETGAIVMGSTISVTIRDNGRGDADSTPGVVTDPAAPAIVVVGELPATGTDAEQLLVLALCLLLAGLGAHLVTRRTRVMTR